MKRYFALLLASLLLASCAVYTPAGSVVVDPNGPARAMMAAASARRARPRRATADCCRGRHRG